jgi:hypothetical protein
MLELRGEVDLAAESLDADLGGQLGRQHLDDHFTAETPFFGHEHARHTAAELVLERVVTAKGRLESLAKVGVHGSWSARAEGTVASHREPANGSASWPEIVAPGSSRLSDRRGTPWRCAWSRAPA